MFEWSMCRRRCRPVATRQLFEAQVDVRHVLSVLGEAVIGALIAAIWLGLVGLGLMLWAAILGPVALLVVVGVLALGLMAGHSGVIAGEGEPARDAPAGPARPPPAVPVLRLIQE